MSQTFETVLKSAATQFISTIQQQLVEHLWSQFSEPNSLTKEKLEKSLSEFFNQQTATEAQCTVRIVEKVVEEKPKAVKKTKSANTCEVPLATGEKKGQPCGASSDEQVDGVWMCKKHKTSKASKKPVGVMSGFVGEPVDTKKKKIAGELPNEQIPLNLKELQGSVEETLLKQVDNLENLLNENKPVVEDKPKESPKKSEEKVVEPKKVKKSEEKTSEEAPKVEKKKKKPEPVEEQQVVQAEPVVEPPVEKKKVLKRRKKVDAPKPISDPAMDALEAADV